MNEPNEVHSETDQEDFGSSSALESPFRSVVANRWSRGETIAQAEAQFTRYEERLARQHEAINRLLAHHAKAHPECDFSDPGVEE